MSKSGLHAGQVASLSQGHEDTQPSVVSPAHTSGFPLNLRVFRLWKEAEVEDNLPCLRESMQTKHKDPETQNQIHDLLEDC